MRTSLNPLMYKLFYYSHLFEEAGTYELLLSPGTYFVATCGGGGAGGSKGEDSSGGQLGGFGGSGGSAIPTLATVTINESLSANVYVGAGGLTKENGGNGGNGGSGSHPGGDGGGGGGGGMPTYIHFSAPINVNGTATDLIISTGGGGGGGGGGGNEGNRSAEGAGGGGGGGSYSMDSAYNIVNLAGKTGGDGGGTYSNGGAGINGYGTETQSGAGGRGYETRGGAAASGFGASGGGGGGGKSNDDSGWKRPGGAGGGGAGGSITAGGGGGGTANGESYNAPGENAGNYRQTPIKLSEYFGQNTSLGMGGNGQTDSQAATNGYNGWFFIIKIQDTSELDMGGIDGAVDKTIDCGATDENTTSVLNMGQIA